MRAQRITNTSQCQSAPIFGSSCLQKFNLRRNVRKQMYPCAPALNNSWLCSQVTINANRRLPDTFRVQETAGIPFVCVLPPDLWQPLIHIIYFSDR